MKKVLLLTVLAAGIAAISSCNKDRLCECDITATGVINLTLSQDTTFVNVSKSDAETKCAALNESYSEDGNTIEVACELM